MYKARLYEKKADTESAENDLSRENHTHFTHLMS